MEVHLSDGDTCPETFYQTHHSSLITVYHGCVKCKPVRYVTRVVYLSSLSCNPLSLSLKRALCLIVSSGITASCLYMIISPIFMVRIGEKMA